MDRLNKLRKLMRENDIENLLVTSGENLLYYSGFTGGEAYMLLCSDKAYLFTDFRYKEQIRNETTGFEILIIKKSLESDLACFLNDLKIKKLFFESSLTYISYSKINTAAKECELACSPDIVDLPRQIKDEKEISLIKRSCEIASDAFSGILSYVRPGIREKELALELEYLMKKSGAEDISFKSTVASGKRSSLPHGTASDKMISSNDIITFDFGARYKGYCSDITRTVFIGSCTKKQREVYEVVLEAQKAALAFISPGKSCFEADYRARQIISEKGYAGNFGHGLGHGVGLMIHERPRLSPLADKSDMLESGMTVTVEPGVYIEDGFGVRIEDTVLITNNGVDVFTKPEKEIIIL